MSSTDDALELDLLKEEVGLLKRERADLVAERDALRAELEGVRSALELRDDQPLTGLAAAAVSRINDLEFEVATLRTLFRANVLRLAPKTTESEIRDVLDSARPSTYRR